MTEDKTKSSRLGLVDLRSPTAEPIVQLLARARRAHVPEMQVEPVARGLVTRISQDFDPLTGGQPGVERRGFAIDEDATTAMPHLGVHAIGEIERGRALRELLDVALRSEDEDLVAVEVDLERVEQGGGLDRGRGRGDPHGVGAGPRLPR